MVRHRYPVGDIKPHLESLMCDCNPELYEGDHYDVAMHHAFDRREVLIQAEIALGFRCAEHLEYLDREKSGHVHTSPPPSFDETVIDPHE